MFEAAELGRTLTREEYHRAEARLRPALLELQRRLKEQPFPVVIVVGGVDGAGKGESVNLISEWLDPRGLQVNVFGLPGAEERRHPDYWRFWMELPPRGRIGVFFGSWYTAPIVDRVEGRLGKGRMAMALADIVNFERQLADDGALLVKYWFHLSRKAQKQRLRSLEKDKLTAWRVTREDWKRFAKYDRFRRVSELALQATSTGHAPWSVIEGSDPRYRGIAVMSRLHDALAARLEAARERRRPAAASKVSLAGGASILDSLDMGKRVADKVYKQRLPELQGRLFGLARRATLESLPVVVVYEGFDASGKGGNIRRLTQAMDARNFRVVPIAAPSDEERARPYLWRFWRALGPRGRITIFDRSWYGRVLVERVEGFCSEPDWRRAYAEINEFEAQLGAFGYVVVKFWIHVTKDEQLRRFKERERLAFKRFKITEEDWRNRKQWEAYVQAVDEMVLRTSTPFAPWTLVEGNDKKHARLKTLETLCARLEKAL